MLTLSQCYNLIGTMSKNRALWFENVTDDIIKFYNYYTYYSNLAMDNFKWVIDKQYKMLNSDFIEKLLFYKGVCAVVRINDVPQLCTFVNISKSYNLFGYPTRINAYDVFNNDKMLGTFESEDFVIIENNKLWYPTNLIVLEKSNKLANISEAIDINTDGQKYPVVFQGSIEQKRTLQEMSAKYVKGERPLYVDKDFKVDDITCINPDVPFRALELFKAGENVKNEMLSMIGIDNVNISKESGVSPDEVNSNNELVKLSYDMYLSSREKAVKELFDKFGIEVSLEYQKANTEAYNLFNEEV